MTFAHRCKQKIPLVAGLVVLALTITTVWYYLIKPWPGVEASPDWTLVDAPPNDEYRPGDILTWTRKRICVPSGVTTVEILTRRELDGDTFDTVTYKRYITTDGYCGDDAPTSIFVPFFLRNGPTQIIIRSCTDTPNPRDTCVESEGPTFTVVGSPY